MVYDTSAESAASICHGTLSASVFPWVMEHKGYTGWYKLLLKVVDHVRATLQEAPMEWDSGQWTRVLERPPHLQDQMDLWSCSLYVLKRVQAIAENCQLSEVNFREKDKIQQEAMNIVLELP